MYIERRPWHWVEWAIFGIFTSWLGMGLLFAGTDSRFGDLTDRLYIMAGVFICYGAPLLVWRPGYTNKALLPFVVLFTAGALEVYLTHLTGEMVSVMSILLLALGFHARGKLILFDIIAFIFALPLLEEFVILDRTFDPTHWLNMFIGYSSLFAIGYGVQRLLSSNTGVKELYEENLRQYKLIQEQNNALEQYANQVEKLTLLEERNRLARDLHDTVGHTFTSVIMGMDAVSYLLDAAPDKAKEKLDVLRQITRNGLDEVRRSIHQIAPQEDEGTFQQQMSRLANEFAVHTGTQVKLNQSGVECELPKQTQLTLIRCLQESLTNAKRHGRAAVIEIQMDYQHNQVKLVVQDDGIGSKQLESGFGLTSMRERLDALQGRLAVDSSQGEGTVVTCTVPIRR